MYFETDDAMTYSGFKICAANLTSSNSSDPYAGVTRIFRDAGDISGSIVLYIIIPVAIASIFIVCMACWARSMVKASSESGAALQSGAAHAGQFQVVSPGSVELVNPPRTYVVSAQVVA
jgi:hypothetical protein